MGKEYTRAVSIKALLPLSDQVVFYDDFSSLLKWSMFGALGNYILELDPSDAKHGSQSLYMATRSTGAIASDHISAQRLSHLLPSKILAFTCSFKYPTFANFDTLKFEFHLYNGAAYQQAVARYTRVSNIWSIVDPAGGMTNLTGITIPPGEGAWHIFTLIINFATSKYLSIQVDSEIEDISANDTRLVTPDTTQPHLLTRVDIKNQTTTQTVLNIDEIMVHELQ